MFTTFDMRDICGFAVAITEENRHDLANLNGGVVPELEKAITYLYIPSDPAEHNEIIDIRSFHIRYVMITDTHFKLTAVIPREKLPS